MKTKVKKLVVNKLQFFFGLAIVIVFSAQGAMWISGAFEPGLLGLIAVTAMSVMVGVHHIMEGLRG